MKRLFIFLIVILMCLPSPFFSQSFEDLSPYDIDLGAFLLQIQPLSGTFSLSKKVSGEPVPLVLSSSVYGSLFRIIQGQRILSFNQLAKTVRIGSTGNSFSLHYDLPSIGNYSFVFEQVTPDTMGVFFQGENLSDSEVSVQVLFDTHLGEASGSHFIFMDTPAQREFGFNTADSDFTPESYRIFSGPRGAEGLSFFIIPDRESSRGLQVVAGNLRRLTESLNQFSINQNRNFNLLPFSVNDSAILSTVVIPGGSTEKFAFQLSVDPDQTASALVVQPKGLPVSAQARVLQNPLHSGLVSQERVPPASNSDTERSPDRNTEERLNIQNGIALFNELISRLNQALINPEVTVEEIQGLRQRLDSLKIEFGL